MSTFDNFSEATLGNGEKNFIKELFDNLENKKLPETTHDVSKEREAKLTIRDKLTPVENSVNYGENSDPLKCRNKKVCKKYGDYRADFEKSIWVVREEKVRRVV